MPPKTLKGRKLVAVRKDGTSAYYLDSRDRYIYQLLLPFKVWNGWLCAEYVWETTFSKSPVYELVA